MEFESSLGFLLGRTARQLRQKLECQFKQYDITTPQWSVLNVLRRKGMQNVCEIGTCLSFDKATMTGILERLRRRGLIEKNRCSMDGRCFNITLTEKGKKLVDELQVYPAKVQDAAFKGLNHEEVDTLAALLRKVSANTV